MSHSSSRFYRSILAVLCLGVAVLASGSSRAAEPERYAYLFVQGKVGGRNEARAESGVTVRLTSPSRTFETKTDEKGIFVFERLPVASYDLQIITADGRGMRSIKPVEDPRGIRLEIKLGKGAGKTLHLDGTAPGGRVTYAVPERAPNWGKFWKEVGVIVGVAAIFAL